MELATPMMAILPGNSSNLTKQPIFWVYHLELLHLFRDLLSMVNNPTNSVDEELFVSKTERLWTILTSPGFDIYPMSTSVHKLVSHGLAYIRAFEQPPGMLSESAIEARNKYNRRYRENFAFKGNLKRNVRDTFMRLLLTSDPYIFMVRHNKRV